MWQIISIVLLFVGGATVGWFTAVGIRRLCKWFGMFHRGGVIPNDDGQLPPLHYNCRNMTIPMSWGDPMSRIHIEPKKYGFGYGGKMHVEASELYYEEFRHAERGRNEEPMKLDMDAIRKRLGEAVVVGYSCIYLNKSHIGILMPYSGGYVNIDTGSIWSTPEKANSGAMSDWIIRPGDECEMSDDGEDWQAVNFGRVKLTGRCPYLSDNTIPFEFIRPRPSTSPEKVKLQDSIQKMERDLAEMKGKVEGMK